MRQDKNLNVLRTKRAFNMRQKGFHLKKLLLKPIKVTFLEGENPTLILELWQFTST